MDELGSFVSDDELAIAPLRDLGFAVSTLSWRQTELDWGDFEAVIIRTPWDYQTEPLAFLDVLTSIDQSPARLENPLDIVRWNLDKEYLREMDEKGARIVPTIWNPPSEVLEFGAWQRELGTSELIIKPTVSATAEHTYRLTGHDPQIEAVFSERPFMVQPFMARIVDEGEFSLFYFNGEYSHAINKSPKINDFRVQEEHGGIITSVEPDEQLHTVARETIAMIGRDLLYARVDFVRDNGGNYCLMELELIEPALYLRTNAAAPQRFASAVAEMLQ